MRIDCRGQLDEGIAHFEDPDTIRLLEQRGLSVRGVARGEEAVYLDVEDEELFAKWIDSFT